MCESAPNVCAFRSPPIVHRERERERERERGGGRGGGRESAPNVCACVTGARLSYTEKERESVLNVCVCVKGARLSYPFCTLSLSPVRAGANNVLFTAVATLLRVLT